MVSRTRVRKVRIAKYGLRKRKGFLKDGGLYGGEDVLSTWLLKWRVMRPILKSQRVLNSYYMKI